MSESFIAKNMIVSSDLWSDLYKILKLDLKDSASSSCWRWSFKGTAVLEPEVAVDDVVVLLL